MPLTKAEKAELIKEAADALVLVTQERDAALEKCAEYELEKRITKCAAAMTARHLHPDLDAEGKVAYLTEAASQGKLASIEEAVAMYGEDRSLGRVNTDGAVAGAGLTAHERFENFIRS